MGLATTTDTTATTTIHASLEMLKNLYGMPVQVVETIKKENEEKSAILKETTHLRHFLENIVNNFHNTVFHSLFRNIYYFPN